MRPLLVMAPDGAAVDWRRTALRLVMYLAGVVVLALGMVVQTESGLGVASLTCFAQVIADITGMTLGTMITATYCAYIVAQALILRRQFQPRILLEVFFSAVIGIFTDFFMAVMPFHPVGLAAQVATMVASLALVAFGVSLVVNMGVVPNAPDGLVKVVFDTSHVVVALVLSWTVLHTIDAFGITTIIAALFLGKFINVMNRLFAERFQRAAFGSARGAVAAE